MKTSKSQIAGWLLSLLLAVFLILVSAGGKFMDWEGKAEMLKEMGFTTEQMSAIGLVEVVISLLFLLPRTGFLGAVLLTAYLGGAVVTHVRLGDAFVIPIVVGMLVWVALGLRRPEVFGLAAGHRLTRRLDR